jgi:hypothetical protein
MRMPSLCFNVVPGALEVGIPARRRKLRLVEVSRSDDAAVNVNLRQNPAELLISEHYYRRQIAPMGIKVFLESSLAASAVNNLLRIWGLYSLQPT